MMQMVMEGVEGVVVSIDGVDKLRCADDAVLVADSLGELGSMLYGLNWACKVYGMEVNVKKN